MTEDYQEMYERLICCLKGLQMGCKLLEAQGNKVIGIDVIYEGIERAIKESQVSEVEE